MTTEQFQKVLKAIGEASNKIGDAQHELRRSLPVGFADEAIKMSKAKREAIEQLYDTLLEVSQMKENTDE